MRKTLLALAAALATVLLAAPGALAERAPYGYRFVTDTLAPGGGHVEQSRGYRFVTDTLAPGGGTVTVAVAGGPSFSWPDAGIGAGTAVGALLVLVGGSLVVARRRGRLAV